MEKRKNLWIALAAILLSGCQRLDNLFRLHLWVAIWIIGLIVLLIVGLVIKLSQKKPD
jgi:hypothetical protein